MQNQNKERTREGERAKKQQHNRHYFEFIALEPQFKIQIWSKIDSENLISDRHQKY